MIRDLSTIPDSGLQSEDWSVESDLQRKSQNLPDTVEYQAVFRRLVLGHQETKVKVKNLLLYLYLSSDNQGRGDVFRISDFGLDSSFGFRHSDFLAGISSSLRSRPLEPRCDSAFEP